MSHPAGDLLPGVCEARVRGLAACVQLARPGPCGGVAVVITSVRSDGSTCEYPPCLRAGCVWRSRLRLAGERLRWHELTSHGASRGAGGVRPGMSFEAVEKRWGNLAVFFPNSQASRAGLATSSLCVGHRPVAAGWTFGDLEGSNWRQHVKLSYAWFFNGVRTQAGIRIGSTLRELRASYGGRLTPVTDNRVLPGTITCSRLCTQASHLELRWSSPSTNRTAVIVNSEG